MATLGIAVVEAFVTAVNRHAPAEMAPLMTEDHTFVDSGGAVSSGRELTIAGWVQYFRMFPDYRIRIQHLLAEENLVAAFGSASGTYNGKRGLVPANRIEMPAAWKAVVQAGRIQLWQVYADWSEGNRTINEDATS